MRTGLMMMGVCPGPFLWDPSREGGSFFLRDKGGLYREMTLEPILQGGVVNVQTNKKRQQCPSRSLEV